MVVFGIDPGCTVTAWGVIDKQRGRFHYVDSGYVRTSPRQPMVERLGLIHAELMDALERHPADEVAIEAIFRHKSSESAIRLGQARGVALLAAGQRGYEPAEINASTVKATVGAWGRADKAAVARMVKMILGELPEGPADLTDALAIAIAHCSRARAASLVRSR